MVHHIVFFKFKPDATTDAIDLAINKLNTFKAQIPGVEYCHAALNFSDRSGGHQVVLLTTFADKKALDIYIDHPYHVQTVAEYIKPIMIGVTVGDIEA